MPLVEVLELGFVRHGASKRALRRCAAIFMAGVLRDQLGYPGAALACLTYAEGQREQPSEFGDEPDTVVMHMEAL